MTLSLQVYDFPTTLMSADASYNDNISSIEYNVMHNVDPRNEVQ